MKRILLILLFFTGFINCFLLTIGENDSIHNSRNVIELSNEGVFFQDDKNSNFSDNYSINYILNGGYNPMNVVTYYNGDKDIILPTPTRDNSTFLGWYTDSDYKNIITTIDKGSNINYNLYAKWDYNPRRNYNYLFYTNNDNYVFKNQNDIKRAIYNGLNEGKDTITLYCSFNNEEDCLNIFNSVYMNRSLMVSINNYVSPYNRLSNLKYKLNIKNGRIKIDLTFTKKYSDDQIREIDKRILEYLKDVNIDEMNDIQKIEWAHDFIIDRNRYDEFASKEGHGDAYSAYGALIGNRATCQGYSEAMAILLDRFGIPNIMISSDTHVWNLVNVNGRWLHIDVTWDDPIVSNGIQVRKYDYYMVTSNNLSLLDSTENHRYVPNYYLESST